VKIAYNNINIQIGEAVMGRDYSIKNTTKVQREKIANEAMGLSILGAAEPSEEAKTLIGEYINGKMELEDVLKATIERYSKAV